MKAVNLADAKTIPQALQTKIEALASNVPTAPWLGETEKAALKAKIKALLKQYNAKLVAHYYVDDELQALAEETGGKVADSLEMANFGAQSDADMLVVCGVRFMGETAKMLSPEKTILMPDLEATCSLDEGCPAKEFGEFCAQYPDHKVVVYANTSVEVKAIADWVVTSGNALEIVSHLKAQGEKIIWAPDQHLGHWIEKETGIEMIRWQANCLVHNEFQTYELEVLKQQHPDALVLVHPESPAEVIELADIVGSTRVMIEAVQNLPNEQFIVATDYGIFYKMQQLDCPWMAMNSLENLATCLENKTGEIKIEESIRVTALASVERMLSFSRQQGLVKTK